MSQSVYYSKTRIAALWKQTQQRRLQGNDRETDANTTSLIRPPQAQESRQTSPVQNQIQVMGSKRTAGSQHQRQDKKQREIYNHYAGADDYLASEMLDGDFAQGGFGTEWEGMGCAGYGR